MASNVLLSSIAQLLLLSRCSAESDAVAFFEIIPEMLAWKNSNVFCGIRNVLQENTELMKGVIKVRFESLRRKAGVGSPFRMKVLCKRTTSAKGASSQPHLFFLRSKNMKEVVEYVKCIKSR